MARSGNKPPLTEPHIRNGWFTPIDITQEFEQGGELRPQVL